jgi:hypothetical protein
MLKCVDGKKIILESQTKSLKLYFLNLFLLLRSINTVSMHFCVFN